MDCRLFPLVTLLALFAGSEAFQCYECEWREVIGIDIGDEDDCREISPNTDVSRNSNCRYCITKTMDKLGHNWIERSCSTESRCQDALEEETWEDQVYEVEKHCCDSNKCNRQPFYPDDDAATRAPLAGSLFAAILFSIWLNFRL